MYEKHISVILIIIISLFLCHKKILANSFLSGCKINTSYCDQLSTQNSTNNFPINVNANYAEWDYPNNFIFIGNVDINYSNNYLHADKVQLNRKSLKETDNLAYVLNAIGNIHYNNEYIYLNGEQAWLDINSKDAIIWKGNYQIINFQGRGKADLIKQKEKNRYTILKNGYFTSCPSEFEIWSILGRNILYDHEEQIAKIWNAYFKIKSIPIFYIPYLKIPLGDKRYSGFLIPNIRYNTFNYFELYIPYYWNISPNMDFTTTLHYISEHDNLILENEFRYLFYMGNGLIELDYLPFNQIYKNGFLDIRNSRRWLFYWQHKGNFNKVCHFNINYKKVSDPKYFKNFESKYGSGIDNYAIQNVCLNYSTKNFSSTILTKQFQILNQNLNHGYFAKPQIDINWYFNQLNPLNLHVYSQAVHFSNVNHTMPESNRLHVEPTVSFLFSNHWLSTNTEAKLMATYYQQKNFNKCNKNYINNFENSVIRLLPQFKINIGNIILERNMNYWANNYIQTLEPRIQYLYIPYKDQSKIWNYNSSLLQYGYVDGLFRDRIYGGLDRITSANQLATDITTRIYDKTLIERFYISIGQIYYFVEPKTGVNDIHWKKEKKTGSLIWASDTYWHITNHLDLHGGINYDVRLDNVATGKCTIKYHLNKERSLQLNYRYANQIYIQNLSPIYKNKSYLNKSISQVGFTTSWSITDLWSIISNYYYNFNENKQSNHMLALQYKSCCCAFRISYEHKIRDWNIENKRSNYNGIIEFNVELRSPKS